MLIYTDPTGEWFGIDDLVVAGAAFTLGYLQHGIYHSLRWANDAWGDKEDRWRTNAMELTIGKWSVGTYLYTNYGKRDGGGVDYDTEAPLLGKNKNGNGAWKNGRVYSAPLWLGYRSKRGNQTTRVGFNFYGKRVR